MNEIELDHVDFASAGAVGEPGQRTFLIQGFKNDKHVSVVVEKQQIELLSEQSIEFLDSLRAEFPDEIYATPRDFDNAGMILEIDPSFRAKAMGLIFDPETLMVTLELREIPLDENETSNKVLFASTSQSDIDDNENNENIVRLTMTRTQLRAMAVRGRECANAGRETCPLCQGPMDLSGHSCPRLN